MRSVPVVDLKAPYTRQKKHLFKFLFLLVGEDHEMETAL